MKLLREFTLGFFDFLVIYYITSTDCNLTLSILNIYYVNPKPLRLMFIQES